MNTAPPSPNTLQEGLQKYLLPQELEQLTSVRVGIAGCGGLGSNVAMLLARSGVQDMLLIDYDVVEPSNLNRQLFFPRHVGMPKVQALAEILQELNPKIRLECRNLRLDPSILPSLLAQAPLWVEALDEAGSKRFFVEAALMAQRFTVSASGIAGCGGAPMQVRHMGKYLTIVGDFSSDIATLPPLAPRVMQAAAMQADAMLAYILAQAASS